MPYEDPNKNREWHKEFMRKRRHDQHSEDAISEASQEFKEHTEHKEGKPELPRVQRPQNEFEGISGANPFGDTSLEPQETHEHEVNRKMTELFGEHTEGFVKKKPLDREIDRTEIED